MSEAKMTGVLKGQRICGIGILIVGIVHTAFHFIIPQPSQALAGIVNAGVVNTLGTDWASATFSTLMSLTVGFLFLIVGILVYQAAGIPWQLPLLPSVALTLLFLFIVIAGPNGGGWLGLPFCIYLLVRAIRKKPQEKMQSQKLL